MRVSRKKVFMGDAQLAWEVKLKGDKLDRVTKFEYLGSTVMLEGGAEKEVTKRLQACWEAWKKVRSILCNKNVPLKVKGNMLKTLVRPALKTEVAKMLMLR